MLEEALRGQLSLLGALLAGVASLVADRPCWSTSFRSFEGDGSPLAAVLERPPAWGRRKRGDGRATELLHHFSAGVRDQLRLVDAGAAEPLVFDVSTSVRGHGARITVRAHEGTYELLHPGPAGALDLVVSARGLVQLARREAGLPDLAVAGELVGTGDVTRAPYLAPQF